MPNIRRVDIEEKRFYETPIGLIPSATTVLRILNKPALVGWAAKKTAEYMGEVLSSIADGKLSPRELTKAHIEHLIKKAKGSYREESASAMNIGADVHGWIEDYYKSQVFGTEREIREVDPDTQQAILAFIEWDRAHQVRPICVEEMIWSNERFAGTLDLYAEVGGQLTLLDFKSATGHWDENVIQLGAYDLAFRERTGHKIEKYMVVRLDKVSGLPDPKEYSREEVELGGKRFLAILKYFWLTENGKKKEE